MKDLSIFKDKPDPVALPDEEYPDWLWSLTDEALAAAQAGKKPAEMEAESGQPIDIQTTGKGGKVDFKAERRILRAR